MVVIHPEFVGNLLDFYERDRDIPLSMDIKRYFVSAFDHWLTNVEAEKMCWTFSMLKQNIDNPLYKKRWNFYYEHEKKFTVFYESLFDFYIYRLLEGEISGDRTLIHVSDVKDYRNLYISNIREDSRNFNLFFVDKLNLAINGGFDLTHEVFLNNNENFGIFAKLVSDAGLYILK